MTRIADAVAPTNGEGEFCNVIARARARGGLTQIVRPVCHLIGPHFHGLPSPRTVARCASSVVIDKLVRGQPAVRVPPGRPERRNVISGHWGRHVGVSPAWIGGQGTEPYEQKTQQSPAFGRRSSPQPVQS